MDSDTSTDSEFVTNISESTVNTSGSENESINIIKSDQVRILHLNACSLRNKINQLEVESRNFDIICVTETWLNSSVENELLKMEHFNEPVRRDRANDE